VVVTARDAEALPPALRSPVGAPPAEGAPGEAIVVARTLRDLRVHARLREPGVLHVSDAYAPGWRVRVDGEERPIVPANGAFRAVALEPGEHEVVFRYAPPSLARGAVGSALALLSVASALAARRLWRRRRGP
jgi:uncharacterized membrane protein YfhO